jgi:hypothetical protein
MFSDKGLQIAEPIDECLTRAAHAASVGWERFRGSRDRRARRIGPFPRGPTDAVDRGVSGDSFPKCRTRPLDK